MHTYIPLAQCDIFNKMIYRRILSYNPNTVSKMSDACVDVLKGVPSDSKGPYISAFLHPSSLKILPLVNNDGSNISGNCFVFLNIKIKIYHKLIFIFTWKLFIDDICLIHLLSPPLKAMLMLRHGTVCVQAHRVTANNFIN